MIRLSIAAAAALALLTACGGGGSDSGSGTTQSAEGIWRGADASALITADGTIWAVDNDLFLLKGTVSVSGSQVSGSGKIFLQDQYDNATLSGTVTTGQTMLLTLASTGGSATSSFTYSPAYEQPAVVSTIAGSYVGASGDTMTLSSAGAVTGVSVDGCHFTGTVSGNTKGYYGVQVTFGAAPCVLAGSTVQGVMAPTQTAGQLVYGLATSAFGTADLLTKQ